jgi:hypothetical protein
MSDSNNHSDFTQWLGTLQQQLQRLLDLDNPITPAARSQELLALSQRFLELSRTFLELGKKASLAAESLMRVRDEGDSQTNAEA